MKTTSLPMLALASFLAIGHVAPAIADSTHDQTEERQQSLDRAQANLTILAFAKSKPATVFERVRYTMADAIEVNNSLSLQQAYAIAVYLHYDVTASNYRKFGISTDEYSWLMSSKKDRLEDHASPASGRI
jgi:hypothetical protein